MKAVPPESYSLCLFAMIRCGTAGSLQWVEPLPAHLLPQSAPPSLAKGCIKDSWQPPPVSTSPQHATTGFVSFLVHFCSCSCLRRSIHSLTTTLLHQSLHSRRQLTVPSDSFSPHTDSLFRAKHSSLCTPNLDVSLSRTQRKHRTAHRQYARSSSHPSGLCSR